MDSGIIRHLVAHEDWLTALARWTDRWCRPLPADQPSLGLSAPSWSALQAVLLSTGHFSCRNKRVAPSKKGRQFLASLSEIYRGKKRHGLYAPILEFLGGIERGAAADIGCGAGYMLHQLGILGFQPLFGYDLLEGSLEIALAYSETLCDQLMLFAEDATNMAAIEDKTLSLIFSRVALHYFDHSVFSKTVQRVLRPGAYLVMESVGIAYYLQPHLYLHSLSPWRWRRILSSLAVLLRSAVYEVTGTQFRFGAKTPEIGWTRHSLERFASWAGLEVTLISSAPTTKGYLAIMRKPLSDAT